MFKVGDRVEIIFDDSNKGNLGVITDISSSGSKEVLFDRGSSATYSLDSSLKLIKNNSIIMSLTNQFKNLFISEPEKSFRAVGVQDDAGNLTSEGKEIFTAWLFEKNKAEFNTAVVQPLIESQKAEEKK